MPVLEIAGREILTNFDKSLQILNHFQPFLANRRLAPQSPGQAYAPFLRAGGFCVREKSVAFRTAPPKHSGTSTFYLLLLRLDDENVGALDDVLFEGGPRRQQAGLSRLKQAGCSAACAACAACHLSTRGEGV
eukprot:929579-Prorocentrum_minimum.AAC.2